MNTNKLIQTHIEDNIYFITLNRPEKRNALTIEMLEGISEAAYASDKYPDVRAIIIHGEGKMFSSGIDVMSLMDAKNKAGNQNPARWLRRMADRLQYAMHTIESTELPIIGALHGYVIGLGLELALTFDFRVANRMCQFRMPETALGLVADVGGTTRLARIVGSSRAKDMLMTARSIDTEEALSWGLINRVANDDDIITEAIDLAEQIMKNAPLAVALTKRIIDQGDGLDKYTQMAIERWAQSQLITTEDLGEALTAFMTKRQAKFKGR
ncbi:MAG: hypothetical protein B6242_05895 [Anaerolineaceae bacterium 4572_78]|nr:MAG: hypothetical protein B6242_05895 [Anaerolineaceae bacterium 4572_78]